MLTGIKEINQLIFNNLNIEDLVSLSYVNNKMNNEVKDIILKYNICSTVIKTLSEIRTKNLGSDENVKAEHLLLEMYFDMKKYQNKF